MLRFVASGTWVLLGWLWSTSQILLGQEQPLTVPTKYYSLNEGLSERLVTDIVQTQDGYLWIATSNGLNKFDGYEFVVFNNSPDNPNRLSEFDIDHLQQTRQGKLVLVYRNKLSFFDILDPATHKVYKINTLPANGILGTVRQIVVNPQGDILVLAVSTDGTFLYRYQPGKRFQLLFQIQEERSRQTASVQILPLNNGTYLLNDSEKGLRLLNAKGVVQYHYQAGDLAQTEANAYPSAAHFMHQDRQGRVWISFQKSTGVYLWSEAEHRLNRFYGVPMLQHYTNLWEDKAGNVLFARTNGNTPFPRNEQLFCLKKSGEIDDFSYLTALGPYIQAIHSDNFFKTIFLGIDTGLKIAQNNYSRITTLLSRPLNADQRGAILRGITGNEQTIYFAEEGGAWYALDLATNRLQKMELYDANTGTPLELTCTLGVHLDASNQLWGISCNNLGEGMLLRCDPATGATQVYTYPYVFRAMAAGANGVFWLLAQPTTGDHTKLLRFQANSGKFEEYKNHEKINPLRETTPWFVMESRNGTVWVGTEDGLVRIDPQNLNSRTYTMQSAEHGKGLRSNLIYCIHEDPQGHIWLGTNNGLSILNPVTNEIVTYDRKDGLASNTVCGIVPDEKGNYWISTYNGLSYFDYTKRQFHNFYQADGLSHDEFNRFSYYRDLRGRYYFGSVNGLNIFYGKDLLVNEKIPSVVFTKLVRFDSKKDSLLTCYNCLASNGNITIHPYDTYFQVNFMLPQFANPAKNQFSVKLEGYDKSWTYLGNTPSIRYSKLPPGDYTLLVKGADPNGNWSQKPVRLFIKVEKTFYQTVWFYLACIGLAAAITYAAFRYQLEQKLQVERFRTKLSSDLHDELSGLLSGIAMQTDMLQMTSQDHTINARLRHIGEVSRKAMSKMSDVIWSIDSRKDKVEDLVKRMYEHADDILLPLNIHYTFTIKRLEYNHRIPPTTRQELYLIFKEAINNIAKHSDAQEVKIVMGNLDNGIFGLEIKDDGKGNPRPHNGHAHSSGQGLSNIKMRAQRINAKVEIIKEAGYTIRLKMRRFA